MRVISKLFSRPPAPVGVKKPPRHIPGILDVAPWFELSGLSAEAYGELRESTNYQRSRITEMRAELEAMADELETFIAENGDIQLMPRGAFLHQTDDPDKMLLRCRARALRAQSKRFTLSTNPKSVE